MTASLTHRCIGQGGYWSMVQASRSEAAEGTGGIHPAAALPVVSAWAASQRAIESIA